MHDKLLNVVNYLELFYNDLLANGIPFRNIALGLLAGMVITFLIQIVYYLIIYGKIPRFRNNRGIRVEIPSPPVSVVVVVRENHYFFVEHGLPKLLEQEYDTFEVVVVDCSYNEEISNLLAEAQERYPHMHMTQIKAGNQADHSIKLAITVGIKAAQFEHLMLTTADSYPPSQKWLSLMAKGFISGEVVLGYCGIEQRKTFGNKLIRCSRMAESTRWLSAATRGRAYRGISHNLGYTKSLYFAHRGFNHLNMNIGDDDLFIRKIVTRENVSVVMNPKATMRQLQYGGLGWWATTCKYYSQAYRYYPAGARFTTGLELWSRFLFFGTAIAAAIMLPLIWKTIPAAFLLLRLVTVVGKMRRIAKRLGERKLMWAYPLYDFYAPLTEALLAVSRTIRPNRTIWR